jgi:Domain of unknown function (DUF4169)
MAEIVNLRTARKRAKRQRDHERAAKARVLSGLSKAERALANTENSKFRRGVDEHRIKTGESDEIAGR